MAVLSLEVPVVSYYFQYNAFVQNCIDSYGTLVVGQYFDTCMVIRANPGGRLSSSDHMEFRGPYKPPFHAPRE